jgi:hypothetical protein
MFPNTAAEMDDLLGFYGERVPDLRGTPGRNKVVWRLSAAIKITYEEHPYHFDAPEFHKRPHWHLDTPAIRHLRFQAGDLFPHW